MTALTDLGVKAIRKGEPGVRETAMSYGFHDLRST